MKTLRHGTHLGLAAGLLLTALLSVPSAARADEPESVAIVFNLEGAPMPGLPPDAAVIRQAALEILTALTGASHRPAADRAGTEDLVRRHRVRSCAALPAAFLADLRSELGAETLLAVTVLADNGSLTATVRAIGTGQGRVEALGIAAATVSEGTWQRSLADALRRAMPPDAPGHRGGAPLLILSSRGIGLDAQAVRTATACLLAAAVADTNWSVIDPALAAGSALDTGRDPARLDKEGRAQLAERFGITWVVLPEVVSFGQVDGNANAAPDYLADGPAAGPRQVTDMTITLRLLDLRTGRIRAASSIMMPGGTPTGWFGVIHPMTELDQMREGAENLWPRFKHLLEDPTS